MKRVRPNPHPSTTFLAVLSLCLVTAMPAAKSNHSMTDSR